MKTLDFETRLALLMQAKKKKLTMSKMAKESGLNCSVSWISQFFSNTADFPKQSQEKLEAFINNYQK